MYEYRLCLYVCDLDMALFHSWLQGVTSKSVKESESSILNPCGCFPRHGRQEDIRPGKGVKNCREDDCRGESGGVLYGRGERDETGLIQAAYWRLWDAKDSCSCALLCEGWGRVVEWREGGTATMRKALEWPTTSTRALPTLFLTGTVSLDVEDSWLRNEQMQRRWSGSADCRE